jgi:hypothetical protein
MKTGILTIAFIFIVSINQAQDSLKKPNVYHNEFGVDVTSFFRQFINQGQTPTYYTPNYYLTYRRYLKTGNIRFAIGGDFDSHNLYNPYSSGDSIKLSYNASSFDIRLGWEFCSELSKHWQVFYGADLRSSFQHVKNDAPYFNNGYANGIETKDQIYGLAPLLGFRFRITNRLSISTETSFSINWQRSSDRRYNTQVSNLYTPTDEIVIPKTTKIYSNFRQPIYLFLTFSI